ncbi:hypothetical protein HBH53_231130 [Parastagonospora nodorum]|nr:hypothetical protein HBH53_231130 [Parastagonospora nodorum]KAH3956664.1 hypothetical protein HBH51_237520 [Parastagonospora nodorum]KAH4215660.1 hypothetical protein HBI06_244290 [Parastagonospora nodorum]KAH4224462.1 hypothetical protein HBI05_236550 [Parastagonospora nodorum]KAH4355638.1 hypothetical protein HBH97_236660 [Parastagonospora nodorum]
MTTRSVEASGRQGAVPHILRDDSSVGSIQNGRLEEDRLTEGEGACQIHHLWAYFNLWPGRRSRAYTGLAG